MQGGSSAQGGASGQNRQLQQGQSGSTTGGASQGDSGQSGSRTTTQQKQGTGTGGDEQTGQSRTRQGTTDQKQSGQSDEADSQTRTRQKGEDQTQGDRSKTQSGSQDTEEGSSKRTTRSGEKSGSKTEVNITSKDRTVIKQTIHETHVQPVRDIDVDIAVGVAIPQTIELHPLPPRIVEIVPAYRAYRYFVLADGRIVIVDPDSYEIVYIIA